jgi:hypothetical protein
VAALTVVAVAVAALIPAGSATAATAEAAASGLGAIPGPYLTWYKEAARTCRGLAWEVLALAARYTAAARRDRPRRARRRVGLCRSPF